MAHTLVEKLDFYIPAAQLFAGCREEQGAVFLDSSLTGQLGRYSVIGRNPYMEFMEQNGICYKNGIPEEEPFEVLLDEFLRQNQEKNTTELPLISGALGYLTYDYGRKFEGIPSRHEPPVDMPDAWMIFYDNFIIEDCLKKELYVTASGRCTDAQESIREIKEWISSSEETSLFQPDAHGRLAAFQADFEKQEYQDAIEGLINYIREGDVYVTNMTQQLKIASPMDPWEAFCYLRRHNPSPFGAYMNYGSFQIACSSPERFLQVKDRWIETRPIKGTRKRGDTPEEDVKMKQELIDSEKDHSELLMIVDLERNDLNRVCVPGSVRVKEHFCIEEYATVFHLITSIEGKLKENAGLVDLIRAAFPGGSITGAPKVRAMEIIDELEESGRGIYTGSIGYLALDGSCDLNIVIRTVVHQDGIYHLGVGGGITYESDTEFEYEETLQKAKAIREALYVPETLQNDDGVAFGVGAFETIAVRDGAPEYLQEHLERLQFSLKQLGIVRKDCSSQLLSEEILNFILVQKASCGAVKLMISEKNKQLIWRENHYTQADYDRGFALVSSPIIRNQTSPLTYMKTMNYGDNIMEKRRVKKDGYDEPIFFNTRGELTEGAVTNIFLEKDGKLYTPPVRCGLLPGVMRRQVIEQYQAEERVLFRSDLLEADAVFVTNSLLGIMPVASFDGVIYKKSHIIK